MLFDSVNLKFLKDNKYLLRMSAPRKPPRRQRNPASPLAWGPTMETTSSRRELSAC